MPFQAIPIGLRSNPGDPTSKLAWIYIVHRARLDDAPNGEAWIELDSATLATFCQCSREEAIAAVERLQRQQFLGIVLWKAWGPNSEKDEAFVDVRLPISELKEGERKRIKASPDQVRRLVSSQEYECVTCGRRDVEDDEWHVDHIIPRSKGGADTEDNCQALCPSCNSRKGPKLHFVDFIGGRK